MIALKDGCPEYFGGYCPCSLPGRLSFWWSLHAALLRYLWSGRRYTHTRLDSLDKLEPGNVITFNLHMPFSLYDARVVSQARQFIDGHMKPLTQPLSSMNVPEVLDLVKLFLDEFFKKEDHPLIRYFYMSVQENSGETARNRYSYLYEKAHIGYM